MADFTPKKGGSDKSAAKGSLAVDNTEHQEPPRLYLEHHHLEKLGMTKMPPVGSKINNLATNAGMILGVNTSVLLIKGTATRWVGVLSA